MYINEDNKYTSPADYFYNTYIDMYCVIDTTYAFEYLEDLEAMWESPELLTEVPMPDYITEDYDAPTW